MGIKVVMLDVDGVLIVHPDPAGWSVHLQRDMGLSASLLQRAFFEPHWDDVVHGRAALRERLEPVLMQIASDLLYDDVVDYWFKADAHLNQPLLGEVALIRAQGLSVHLATVQEHERARYLWDIRGLRAQFDGLHYAADLGAAKPDMDFYVRIEARTGFAPQDIFFVDDRQQNVDAALARGWKAALWTGNATLKELLATPPQSSGT